MTEITSSTAAIASSTAQGASPAGSHLNFMAGRSWSLSDPLLQLRIAAASCFFGEPQFYEGASRGRKSDDPLRTVLVDAAHQRHIAEQLQACDPREWRGLDARARMERAIDRALDADPEGTLQLAVVLRKQNHMRLTPQVILVRAANHPKVTGTGLVGRYAAFITARMDEPALQKTYHEATFGKRPIPNALRKAWAARLARANAYELAKYRGESDANSLVDVVNYAHPKPLTPETATALKQLVEGKLKLTDETWEAIVSREGSTPEAWAKALDVMGHMALLRNLRNLVQKGASPKVLADKLREGAANGKQLPFRYWSAFRALKNEGGVSGELLDAVEQSMLLSMKNLPEFRGRVMSLCDNSGSAQHTMTSAYGSVKMSEIANLTGILTGLVAEDGHVGVFGDRLTTCRVRKTASIFDQLTNLNTKGEGVGGGTEHGIWLFFENAFKKKEHWDHIFIYSDMQAGHGGLYGTGKGYKDYVFPRAGHGQDFIDVPKLIAAYREKVNPKVNVHLVQCAGYQDTLVPETYYRTSILGGWGDGVLAYAAEMSALFDGLDAQKDGTSPFV